MDIETVTCSYGTQYGGGRYGVFLVLDGALTSWDCSHLHHSAKAALACHRSLRKHAERWLAQPTLTLVQVPSEAGHLWEARYDSSAEPGFGTTASRRFRWPYDEVEPLAVTLT